MADDKKKDEKEQEQGQTVGTKFDDAKEVKDSKGHTIKVGDRVEAVKNFYNPAMSDGKPDIQDGEEFTVEHITTGGQLWLLEVRDLMNGFDADGFVRLTPMPEQPEVERRRTRFLEIHDTVWRLFKKNREPWAGMAIAVEHGEHLAKVTEVKKVGNKWRVYYEIIAPLDFPEMRCPWCNEPMDYRGNVTNQAEIVVYTCKEDMVEVTVHEPCNDRDMADFLEEYYPEVEREGNDS